MEKLNTYIEQKDHLDKLQAHIEIQCENCNIKKPIHDIKSLLIDIG